MINIKVIREFKPALLFLARFVGLYVVLNLAYGLYVNHYSPKADPITQMVTNQTSWLLNIMGEITSTTLDETQPNHNLWRGDSIILSVYEGCNGGNTMIIFIAFLIAYSKLDKRLLWFIPTGILLIHLFNLMRIAGLFYVTLYWENYLYFVHKYLFTAFLFAVIFVLWYWWVTQLQSKKD